MLTFNLGFAEVVEFSNYETRTTLNEDHLGIQRVLTLQNVGSNPIIPGELHFKTHELEGDKKVPSNINNFEATNDYDMEMETQKVKEDKVTDLVVSIWEPILPKFSYKIYMNYDIEFEPKGILFYELRVPNEETTIPIKESKNEIMLPENYHVTYAPDAEVTKREIEGETVNVVSWSGKNPVAIEYSVVPLPRIGIKAVNVFWGVIIIITLVFSYLFHKRLR
ncbi:MAG: hypothetical protein ACOCQX_02400 [Candidatus Nanoarchaeia archaeon]